MRRKLSVDFDGGNEASVFFIAVAADRPAWFGVFFFPSFLDYYSSSSSTMYASGMLLLARTTTTTTVEMIERLDVERFLAVSSPSYKKHDLPVKLLQQQLHSSKNKRSGRGRRVFRPNRQLM